MNQKFLCVSSVFTALEAPTIAARRSAGACVADAAIASAGTRAIPDGPRVIFAGAKLISAGLKMISASTKVISAEPKMNSAGAIATFGVFSTRLASSCVAVLAAASTCVGQGCPPGQQETTWQPLSGSGVSILGGTSCGALGQPTMQPGGNLAWPGGSTVVVAGGAEACVRSSFGYIAYSDFCVGGASLTMFGTFSIPPQGGTFHARGGINVQNFNSEHDCASSQSGIIAAGEIGPITYTTPGEYSWAIHAPAYFSPQDGYPFAIFVGTVSYVCLQVNGGSGHIQVLGQGSRIPLRCPADVDDGSNTRAPDGGVDINDLLFFLAAFDAGDLDADLDDGNGAGTPDNAVDINDLLFFLAHFDLGC